MAHPSDRVRRRARLIQRARARRRRREGKRGNTKLQITIVMLVLAGIIITAFYISR